MSVFVSVEDQEGEPLIDVFELDRVHRRFPGSGGVCLRFVGESEDASFNAQQTPLLTAELEGLSSLALDPAERKELTRLLDLCRKHVGKRHEYIRFYGEARPE